MPPALPPLASAFPAATREGWSALVERVLKGASFDKALVSRTADGIAIHPLYGRAVAPEPVPRPPARPWRVCQRLDHPDPAEANRLALLDLEGGADTLALALAGAPAARGFGLTGAGPASVDAALAGIRLDWIALSLETAPFAGPAAVADLIALVRRRDQDPASLAIDLGLDPVGDLARTGSLPGPWPDVEAAVAGAAAAALAAGLRGPLLRVDGRPVHEAGGSEAQELAAALATGTAYLRLLERAGHDPERARHLLSFLLVADADEFMTVAKLRALRRLWARVEEACGLVPAPIRLHAETAWRTTTRRDPLVNLLRGTLAAFSAGIAGADTVTVLPYTAALGLPDAFARRLARNTQMILLEEANLWRVADPVAGAGGFEALTDALVEEGWAWFGEIEREGGIVASLLAGALQGRIAETRARRRKAVATRRDPLIGTSEFPHLAEPPTTVLMPAPDGAAPGAGGGTALPAIRLAEPFERLRDRSDAIRAETGRRPTVFLATLGSLASFTPRATFAAAAFAAVGIEAAGGEAYPDRAALVAAFREAGTPLACLCGSDDLYAAEAEETARGLAAAGAATVALAGRPGATEAALREAGVARFVHVGCDLPEVLGDLLG